MRVHAEQPGEFLHHHVKHQLGQILRAVRAGKQRAPVQHDPRRGRRAAGIARTARARVKPRKRHRIRQVSGQASRRDLLDGELDTGQLGCPPRLELGDRLEHQVVEAFRAAPVDGGVLRGKHAAEAAAVPVPPPDPARSRSAAFACLHNDRAYPGAAGPGPAGRQTGGARTCPRRHDRAECPGWWRYRLRIDTVSRCERSTRLCLPRRPRARRGRGIAAAGGTVSEVGR